MRDFQVAQSLKGVISQTQCKKIGGGRVAAREILLSVPGVTTLIWESKPYPFSDADLTQTGMIQLGDVLIDFVDRGIVSPQEAYMKANDKQAFLAMLKHRGLETGFEPGFVAAA